MSIFRLDRRREPVTGDGWIHEEPAPDAAAARAAARRLGPADALVAGILDLAGARELALDAVLRLCAVEWDDDVSTACVECAHRPRLLLNAAFVERRCATRERLAMLVLHELAHVSLGHTRLFPRTTDLQNVAFDAVINRAVLGALHDAGADVARFAALLESAYAPHLAPWFLLRPPPGWPHAPDWEASHDGPPELRKIHRRLYAGVCPDAHQAAPRPRDARHTVQYEEIVAALRAAACADSVVRRALLGSHGRSARERVAESGGRDAVLSAVLGNALRPLAGGAAEVGGDAFRLQIERAARRAALERALQALIRRAFIDRSGTRRRAMLATRPVRTVLPYHDRRAPALTALAAALGAPRPLLFDGRAPAPRPERQDALVYLDVSGSMADVLPALHAALVPLRRALRPRIHVFSTTVRPVSAAELEAGRVVTTFGTSIDPVLEHLLAPAGRHRGRSAPPRRQRSALVITDGLFAAPSPALVRHVGAAGIRIHLAVTPGGTLHEDEAWVASTTRLPAS